MVDLGGQKKRKKKGVGEKKYRWSVGLEEGTGRVVEINRIEEGRRWRKGEAGTG
jgi:hypothetical protein